jgi:glycyl-tRNA synthetase (class II)
MNPRRLWHKNNRPFVFNHFKGICQKCFNPITSKWDIHHLTYNYGGKLYDVLANELIEKNIIILVCRPCHNVIHTAKDNQNPIHNKFTLENRGICEICGRNERGIYDRKKHQNLNKLTCRVCYLENKKLTKTGIIQTSLF